jgi:hypothetical protein
MQELVRNKESLSSAQRIARLGSWEWFVKTGGAARPSTTACSAAARDLRRGMEALLDHVYGPTARRAGGAEGAREGVGFQLTYRVVWPDGSVRTVLEPAEPGRRPAARC